MSEFVTVSYSKRSRRANIGSSEKEVKSSIVPVCRHCENMGLPSDHWLRSKSGELLCAVLLANKCSYCRLPGHTLKLCPELKAKHERLNSKTVPQVEKLQLIHPDILKSDVPVPCTEPLTDVVYTEYTSSVYKKYAGRSWADITDSDED